ncbi:hypothetical protein Poli38472_009535 [Pythium oligandrum]|uniref:Ion transport domain-containing protein n=1 Tax=Pythium oligandrum TaxID=41045 RepID=A0A8K1FJP8_PYTOL|nr:hypothetical protein Poli38472_009535 [Pythium oligandrum]|eukprot:TMW62042.1 hypothetical protein Poli38472_009535 [Pythium oligandrum]
MAASAPPAEALSVLPGQIESGIASLVTSQRGSVALLTPITETDDHDGDDKGPETELSDEEESTTITQELETKITGRETRMLSTFPTGELIPREKFRFTTRRARLRFYLAHPEQSRAGWIIHHVILLVLIVNIAVMTAETLDGPRFPGSAPVYNYIPGDRFFHAAENFFTAVYVVEFVLRRMATRNRRMFWRVVHTWLDLLALTPVLIYYAIRTLSDETTADRGFSLRFKVGYLRLFRIVRIVVFVQVHDGSKVMTQAIRQSVAPLKVTLFFLITIVMVYATAIFYAEPCYDLYTCTFTDIFNAGYFVMVTVATIGYGSQLPSFSNPVSVVLTGLVMIFGSLYLSMPLAIVGINYETAWKKYEESQHRAQHPRINAVLDPHSPTAAQTSSVPTNQDKELFPSTCADVFGSKGVLQVCHNRLCQPPITLWMDMEPIWMYIEFGFGFLFTVETILRIVSHPQRSKIWKDSELLGDFIALFPFYVELGELAAGITPIYSIIPTAPSFFSVIRVLKSFRILRLGAHIAGSEVLMRTAVLVYKRLMIPIFFLAIGSTICGAIFYEIERGTECL